MKSSAEKTQLIFLFIFFGVLIPFGIYKCPIKTIFGINCPSCGMTRAFIAAIKLDFRSAFQYHPLFPLIGFETLYVIFRKPVTAHIHIEKNVELAVGIASLLLLLVVWFFRYIIH